MIANLKFYSKNEQERINYFIRIIYGLMGGFYYSHRYSNRIRYVWIGVIIFTCIITCIFGCFGYFITTKDITIYGIMYTIVICMGVNVFSLQYLSYYFRNELENIIFLLENDFNFVNIVKNTKKKTALTLKRN